MAISYFKSSQVHVFPCAYRGTSAQNAIDPEARLNTEKNLTNTGNNLKGTYLISKTTSGTVTKVNIVIGGYYFELTMDTAVSGNITWDSLKNKYLAIKLASPDLTAGYQTKVLANYSTGLSGYLDEDTNNTFLGLAICETDTEAAEATAKIKIADNNGSILNDAYLPDISSSTGSKSLASSGCTANGDHATAFGKGLTGTDTAGQMVIGSYNGSADGKLFVIGKGSVGSTSNAFTVDTDGNTYIAGYLKVNTNKFTVDTIGNTVVAGTLGVTGNTTSTGDFKVGNGNGKFNVTATSGNTTIGGTLGVTGATTLSGNATLSGNTVLNATANNDTTLANGSLYLGDGGTNGAISSSGNGVFAGTDGVVTRKLQAYDSNITLASNIIPSNTGTITLGEAGEGFNTIYAKTINGNNSAVNNALILTGSSVSLTPTNGNGIAYATKNLCVGESSGRSFSSSGNITATRDITAGRNITATGTINGGDFDANNISFTGTNSITNNQASILLKGKTISSEQNSITLYENATYALTAIYNGAAYTQVLTLPRPVLGADEARSGEVHSSGSQSFYFKAERGSNNTWTCTFRVSPAGSELSVKWYVVKLAGFDTDY